MSIKTLIFFIFIKFPSKIRSLYLLWFKRYGQYDFFFKIAISRIKVTAKVKRSLNLSAIWSLVHRTTWIFELNFDYCRPTLYIVQRIVSQPGKPTWTKMMWEQEITLKVFIMFGITKTHYNSFHQLTHKTKKCHRRKALHTRYWVLSILT